MALWQIEGMMKLHLSLEILFIRSAGGVVCMAENSRHGNRGRLKICSKQTAWFMRTIVYTANRRFVVISNELSQGDNWGCQHGLYPIRRPQQIPSCHCGKYYKIKKVPDRKRPNHDCGRQENRDVRPHTVALAKRKSPFSTLDSLYTGTRLCY